MKKKLNDIRKTNNQILKNPKSIYTIVLVVSRLIGLSFIENDIVQDVNFLLLNENIKKMERYLHRIRFSLRD